MKYKINAYVAVLLITIVGAGASLLIIRVASTNTFTIVYGSEAGYVSGSTR